MTTITEPTQNCHNCRKSVAHDAHPIMGEIWCSRCVIAFEHAYNVIMRVASKQMKNGWGVPCEN